ncbi:MarR family winged helix-turn-helix transcriptional regulator [Reinekea blandensis]|uniref:Transcriptional regulator marR/emrR family protein n=1 Tax=Reinekea blandensis MED297 TaxID=314283 RepID=A4BBT1_9GAMM|nr:MarR family winged helix-turn-helix transcriptional regulator [Reinekea blandensis]EAR10416.1 transcriptional regulator marR/emrR family protein [Reinekea sp. MED297] [Reinekea blandensis MED297]
MPDVNKTVLRLDRFLPYRLSVLANRISRSLADQYQAEFGISRPQWRVLAVLGETDNLSANDLVDRTAMDKVAVSRAVSGLVNKQLINQSDDKKDKRRSRLSLTPKGLQIYAAIVPAALSFQQNLLANLSAEDIHHLDAILEKLGN